MLILELFSSAVISNYNIRNNDINNFYLYYLITTRWQSHWHYMKIKDKTSTLIPSFYLIKKAVQGMNFPYLNFIYKFPLNFHFSILPSVTETQSRFWPSQATNSTKLITDKLLINY